MATRSRTTFKKRQKELARLEKQRDKAARRMQRKLEKNMPEVEGGSGDELEVQVEGGSGEELEVQDVQPESENPAEASASDVA